MTRTVWHRWRDAETELRTIWFAHRSGAALWSIENHFQENPDGSHNFVGFSVIFAMTNRAEWD
uniref:Uncharacterized protein n=1 Tax=Arundo donax TaxID=35708 RepID=A0A0A9T393_ARUDO